MKKSFLIIGLALGATFLTRMELWAQNCPNIDFSAGNFSNWTTYAGTWSSSGVTNINPSPVMPGRHEIMDAQLLAQQGRLQDEICPKVRKVINGKRYAARLGNSNTGAEMEALEYTMTVDSTNSLLLLSFAFVLENPGHSREQQPSFCMQILDSLRRPLTVIPCNSTCFEAGHSQIPLACTGTYEALEWTTVGFSLEKVMGRTIKIYYETRDCSQSGHGGYTYMVAECRPMRIELAFCSGANAARMQAPDGFKTYTWTRSNDLNWKITGDAKAAQRIVVEQPLDGEIFTCKVESAIGPQCSAELKVEILRTAIDADFKYGIKGDGPTWDPNHVPLPQRGWQNWYDTCNRTATFVERITVYNSVKSGRLWEVMDPHDPSGKSVLQSSTDSLFTYTFPDPNVPTTYKIRLTGYADNGCYDTSRAEAYHHITIYPSPKVEIEGVSEICDGDSTWLKAIAKRSTFINHQWTWIDTSGTKTFSGDSIKIYRPGICILVSQDSAGCFARDTHEVTTKKPKMNGLDIKHVDCYGAASGYITHGAVDDGPYSPFNWIFKDVNGADSIVPANYGGGAYYNLKAGIYRFEAVNYLGCFIYGEYEIKQNDSLQISGIQYPVTCDLPNGKLKLSAKGGVPSYTYKVEREDTPGVYLQLTPDSAMKNYDSAMNLAAGTYRITVTDSKGCTTSDTITVLSTPLPYIEMDANSVDMETCEDTNGNIRVRAIFADTTKFYWTADGFTDTTQYGVQNGIKGGKVYTMILEDGNGCRDTAEIYVPAYASPTVSIAKTPEVCGRGDGTITLNVTSDAPATVVYKWKDVNDTTLSARIGLTAGTYYVAIEDTLCKVEPYPTTIVIDHIPGPVARFEANSYNVASNSIFTLTDMSQGTVRNWNWDMGDQNTQTGRIVYYTYSTTGDYRIFLEVIDTNQCIDTISKIIHVYEELTVFIPNIFTPNGDGINDTWYPKMTEYVEEGYKLTVFDRQGQVIFHTTDTKAAWDGTVKGKKVAPNTVCAYRIIVRDFTGQEYEFVGHVTVLE